MIAVDKAANDNELAEWFYIGGTRLSNGATC